MIDSTTPTIVDLLHDAGLDLSIESAGMLSVSPSSNLNDELRNLIRAHKAALLECVLKADAARRQLQADPCDQVCGVVRTSGPEKGAANRPGEQLPEPPADIATWHELQAAYRAHLTTCRTCMAAEHGNRMRCGAGVALRLVQSDHQSRGQS
jgi:hypothetical protein